MQVPGLNNDLLFIGLERVVTKIFKRHPIKNKITFLYEFHSSNLV